MGKPNPNQYWDYYLLVSRGLHLAVPVLWLSASVGRNGGGVIAAGAGRVWCV